MPVHALKRKCMLLSLHPTVLPIIYQTGQEGDIHPIWYESAQVEIHLAI